MTVLIHQHQIKRIKTLLNNKFDEIITSTRSVGIKNTINVIGITGQLITNFINTITLLDKFNKTILHNVG